ncbi:MAG TPA: CoA-transferase [Bauldia sp.]|nr:CoA-transferase [Bauldia sp.]
MSKIHSLREAIAENVGDGDTVFIGGFGQCIPFAAAHEIVRQRRRRLVLCRSGADIVFDLLVAAGCVEKIIAGYVGNPGLGLAHAFRRAVEAGTVAVEDWTNFAMVLRFHAAVLGVPFLPADILSAGDIPAAVNVRKVVCPYTGRDLSAIPMLAPDVAIIHAQRADAAGNVQLFGLPGDTLEGALASRRIIATVEEIVAPAAIRAAPDRTVLPAFRIAAVSKVRFGAYPSYVDRHYGRDDEAYAEWDSLSRDAAALERWIAAEVIGRADYADYIAAIDKKRLDALVAEAAAVRQ